MIPRVSHTLHYIQHHLVAKEHRGAQAQEPLSQNTCPSARSHYATNLVRKVETSLPASLQTIPLASMVLEKTAE